MVPNGINDKMQRNLSSVVDERHKTPLTKCKGQQTEPDVEQVKAIKQQVEVLKQQEHHMEQPPQGQQQQQGEIEALYCVCRSADYSSFMIACDNCDEWYHGSCVNLSESDADQIDKYYCRGCRLDNPDLHMTFNILPVQRAAHQKTKAVDAEAKNKAEVTRKSRIKAISRRGAKRCKIATIGRDMRQNKVKH